MCSTWPMHLVVLYSLALCPMWIGCQAVPTLIAKFEPPTASVIMGTHTVVNVTVEGLDSGFADGDMLYVQSLRDSIATTNDYFYEIRQTDIDGGTWFDTIEVHGNFLGWTNVTVFARTGPLNNEVRALTMLEVIVTRPERVIDRVFTTSVATFVSLILINFGCAMDLDTVKKVIRRPVGPAIGLCGHFVLMPLLSFGLGFLIFPDDPAMRLGMFFTGVSPAGGSSNIWTFILNGNLNLSLTMTTISTILSFPLMPAWLFSLGQVIFQDARIMVPYARIASFAAGLLVPLAIGLAMQRWTPRIARFMVRILKGFSSLLLLFIIVFAIVTNLYIFQLFTWQIYVAGMAIPWLGYMAGYIFARLLSQNHKDSLTIGIEVGNQNTGIAIFMLRYALSQPAADLTTVIPVSVAIMSPVPMMGIYAVQRIMSCVNKRQKTKELVDGDAPISEAPVVTTIATIEGDKEKNTN